MNKQKYGLGRLYAEDPRDNNYPLKAVLPKKASARKYRYWNQGGIWLDQGETPMCVGYGSTHYLADGPVTNMIVNPVGFAETVYHEAQARDPWASIPHDGTTIRAAAQYLKHIGFIQEYRWGRTLDELIQAVLEVGPVVVGTTWYWDMFEPDSKGFIHPTGFDAGGHAYVINGCNVEQRKFRIKNSWSRQWANNGTAWISFDDFEKLIDPYVEIMLAIEVKR